MSEQIIAIIDEHLNSHGRAVFDSAVNAGFEVQLNESGRLDLADACALVDHESIGGQNIFGGDHGEVGDRPPYYRQPVTKARVQALRAGGAYPHGLNGIGLSQITWWEYVEEAEKRGGAHLPEHQLSVGFEVLKGNVDALGYALGIAAYNAGRGNAQLGITNGYYAKVMEKRAKWVALLANVGEESVADWPTTEVRVSESSYLYDKEDLGWIRCPEILSGVLETDAEGWVKTAGAWTPSAPAIIVPERWGWPAANEPVGYIGDGSYLDLHPTRYDTVWREDVEKLARYLVDTFGVWCNTYVGHPPPELVEGVYYDAVSLDIWGPAGRGDGTHADRVDAAFWWVFNNAEPPWIRWCIRNYEIWIDDGYDWRPYWDRDPWSDGPHVAHGHLTFF